MFIIQKITPRYDQEQDRLSLNVQNAEGQVLLLWLTQRLANRLAQTLGGWLDETLDAGATGQAASSLHAFEQSVAQAHLKAHRPVEPDAAQAEILLTSVDLGRSPDGYVFTFKWGGEGGARLFLSLLELRQLLGIISLLFDAADWPRHAWPSWFAGEIGAAAAAIVLH